MDGLSERPPRVVVVGAGVAGLTTAYRLRSQHPKMCITVVEAAGRIGGKILTERVDGFVIEGGPDSIATFKPQALALTAELGLAGRLRPADESTAGSYVMHRGRLRRLPDGMNGFVPRRIWPMAKTGLLSPLAKLRMALEYAMPASPHHVDETLESFVTRRLGRQVYRRLVEPMARGIFAADPAQLSLLGTLPHLRAAEAEHGGLIRAVLAERRASRSTHSAQPTARRLPSVVAPAAGMSELVEALGRNLPNVETLLGSRLVGIDRQGGGYLLHIKPVTGDRSWLPADAVVLAVPAPAAAQALQGLDHGLAATLRKTRYASTVTVSMGYRAGDVPNRLKGHGYLVPAQEQRMARACTWSSSKFPGRAPFGHVLLRVSLGGAGRPSLTGLTDEHLISMAQRELAASLGITADPVVHRVHSWTDVMPQYTLGHRDRVAAVERMLSAHPGIILAGSGYHGLSIPDCIESGQRAADAVLATLEVQRT